MTPHNPPNADHITPSNPIRVTYDEEVKALYIYLKKPYRGIAKQSHHFGNAAFILDTDSEGKPCGLEILFKDITEEAQEILLKSFDIRKQKIW